MTGWCKFIKFDILEKLQKIKVLEAEQVINFDERLQRETFFFLLNNVQ